MKKLLVYLKDYTKESVLGPLFKLLEACFELFVPLVIAAMIDRGIGGADKPFLVRMTLLLVVLGVVGLVCSLTAQYYAAKAAAGFAKKLKHALFAHIQRLSFAELDAAGTSTMITRMTSDANQVQTGVNLVLRLMLRSPFVVFGAMIMAFTIDVKAALVFAVAIPVLSVVVFGIMLWCIPLYKKVQTHLDGVLGMTRENLSGARVLRAFCKEEEQAQTFGVRNDTLTRVQNTVGRISALMNPVTFVLINAAVIWLIWTGALRVEAGLITQGAVVALYNYMSQILVELIKLASLIITTTKAVASGNRIQDIFALRGSVLSPDHMPVLPEGCPAVEFRHAVLRYRGAAEPALCDIHFAVQPGETVGIIGGTGSGKSSLVHLLPRFYDVCEGEVLVNGADVREYPLHALRARIGLVPQKAVLFKGSIRDNLRWGNGDATDDELFMALTAAQAADVVAGKGGLDAQIEQGGKNLSGGQRQRLTIARALVRRPDILILDDSASALDLATDAALRKALRALSYRPTVFIVSQRAASVLYADRIIVLDDGAVAGMGKSDELLKTCEVYREIFQSQFGKEAVLHAVAKD